MPVDGKSKRRTTRGSQSRDSRRALAICLLFGAIVLVGLGTVIRNSPPGGTRIAATTSAQGNDDLTTGSIVFVPLFGNNCRTRLIDNATWRIRDNGVVDCNAALALKTHDRRIGWSAARLDVVRQGFSRR
jgi:hypothetical protein